MPYKIVRDKDGRGWRLVKHVDGKDETVGHSDTKQKAEISKSIRERAEKRGRKK